MSRNISFMHTTKQFINQSKTVTRRLGWRFLKTGDILTGCEKCQGLRKGEGINRLGQIRVVSVTREKLWTITKADVVAEGFPEMSREEFVLFFCRAMGCKPTTVVTRIKFEYLNERKGRPATQIEVEAFGSTCKMQDELHEARTIIRALLGAPPPRTWKKWPIIHKLATEFLKK